MLTGDWIARDGTGATPDQARLIVDQASERKSASTQGERKISFDTSGLGHWDSALLVFIAELRVEAQKRGIALDEGGLPQAVPLLLSLAAEAVPVGARTGGQLSLLDRTGDAVLAIWSEALEVSAVAGDLVLRGGAAIRGHGSLRGGDLLSCIYDAGSAALPIVTVVNALVGGILAFVGGEQLRRFGADIYVAQLVGIAVVREMAGLMTAIVMSGRTGGAYAAHIATMLTNEEIDALRAIGIPVFDYLVLPRIAALIFVMPLLYLYGCAIGISGGLVVSISLLNISARTFVEQTRLAVDMSQFWFGLIKTIAFGVLIAIAGCRCGLRAGRGAADVGLATTAAVVIGIVGVIALDAVFAVCANILDF